MGCDASDGIIHVDESPVKMWEILVPCQMVNINGDLRPIRTAHHRVWDRRVRAITGGLTIFKPAQGNWISPSGELFAERMIPVRIVATKLQIWEISDITAQHYNQEAVLFYKVSNTVKIVHYKNGRRII